MATKIRLQRHGKKGKPFYYIVVADSRAPRDGKFIERLGSYNPNTNPATINLNFDSAVNWVSTGATPTDTAKTILSHEGVLYKNHLNGGIAKGALTQDQADVKFATWLEGKEGKTQAKKDGLSSTKEAAKKVALEAETKKKEATAAAVLAKNTPPAEEVVEEEATEEVVAEAPAEEVNQEAPAPVEEVVAKEETSAPVEEAVAKEEAPAPVAEVAKEEVKAETPAPAEEAATEETKKDETPSAE